MLGFCAILHHKNLAPKGLTADAPSLYQKTVLTSLFNRSTCFYSICQARRAMTGLKRGSLQVIYVVFLLGNVQWSRLGVVSVEPSEITDLRSTQHEVPSLVHRFDAQDHPTDVCPEGRTKLQGDFQPDRIPSWHCHKALESLPESHEQKKHSRSSNAYALNHAEHDAEIRNVSGNPQVAEANKETANPVGFDRPFDPNSGVVLANEQCFGVASSGPEAVGVPNTEPISSSINTNQNTKNWNYKKTRHLPQSRGEAPGLVAKSGQNTHSAYHPIYNKPQAPNTGIHLPSSGYQAANDPQGYPTTYYPTSYQHLVSDQSSWKYQLHCVEFWEPQVTYHLQRGLAYIPVHVFKDSAVPSAIPAVHNRLNAHAPLSHPTNHAYIGESTGNTIPGSGQIGGKLSIQADGRADKPKESFINYRKHQRNEEVDQDSRIPSACKSNNQVNSDTEKEAALENPKSRSLQSQFDSNNAAKETIVLPDDSVNVTNDSHPESHYSSEPKTPFIKKMNENPPVDLDSLPGSNHNPNTSEENTEEADGIPPEVTDSVNTKIPCKTRTNVKKMCKDLQPQTPKPKVGAGWDVACDGVTKHNKIQTSQIPESKIVAGDQKTTANQDFSKGKGSEYPKQVTSPSVLTTEVLSHLGATLGRKLNHQPTTEQVEHVAKDENSHLHLELQNEEPKNFEKSHLKTHHSTDLNPKAYEGNIQVSGVDKSHLTWKVSPILKDNKFAVLEKLDHNPVLDEKNKYAAPLVEISNLQQDSAEFQDGTRKNESVSSYAHIPYMNKPKVVINSAIDYMRPMLNLVSNAWQKIPRLELSIKSLFSSRKKLLQNSSNNLNFLPIFNFMKISRGKPTQGFLRKTTHDQNHPEPFPDFVTTESTKNFQREEKQPGSATTYWNPDLKSKSSSGVLKSNSRTSLQEEYHFHAKFGIHAGYMVSFVEEYRHKNPGTKKFEIEFLLALLKFMKAEHVGGYIPIELDAEDSDYKTLEQFILQMNVNPKEGKKLKCVIERIGMIEGKRRWKAVIRQYNQQEILRKWAEINKKGLSIKKKLELRKLDRVLKISKPWPTFYGVKSKDYELLENLLKDEMVKKDILGILGEEELESRLHQIFVISIFSTNPRYLDAGDWEIVYKQGLDFIRILAVAHILHLDRGESNIESSNLVTPDSEIYFSLLGLWEVKESAPWGLSAEKMWLLSNPKRETIYNETYSNLKEKWKYQKLLPKVILENFPEIYPNKKMMAKKNKFGKKVVLDVWWNLSDLIEWQEYHMDKLTMVRVGEQLNIPTTRDKKINLDRLSEILNKKSIPEGKENIMKEWFERNAFSPYLHPSHDEWSKNLPAEFQN
ncbi:hypothetical protein PGT21_025896 [Puccinia graminis f. sp. tritici]|uniref:Uncharacterized protein n=1 Tax=Puccinia graminis f. sp. tritici TaxID=56615 RepID=A0A5B0RDH3_PUCGR|nr:hypothetical protein PGT21_025896 [Puccinia graminis f. sp. tritici]KAA1123439.1 hypothetical protein PGTUg99_008973 [Puccinia graminis f. sp. tritici]